MCFCGHVPGCSMMFKLESRLLLKLKSPCAIKKLRGNNYEHLTLNWIKQSIKCTACVMTSDFSCRCRSKAANKTLSMTKFGEYCQPPFALDSLPDVTVKHSCNLSVVSFAPCQFCLSIWNNNVWNIRSTADLPLAPSAYGDTTALLLASPPAVDDKDWDWEVLPRPTGQG